MIDSTIWVDAHVIEHTLDEDGDECVETIVTVNVAIDPEEPECSASRHVWASPEWLGGCRENPGVWGHGGGVVMTEVCSHCGCGRHTDTWAQRPDNGEQGLTSVRYEEGEYADRIEAERDEDREDTNEEVAS